MKLFSTTVIGGLAATLLFSTGAMAQNYYANDAYCRQYADQAVAPLRQQAQSQAVGGALLGAGLGAALGAAAGGGRGAGIGAATGAVVGTGAGAANAQNTDAYAQQQYQAYYANCMQTRQGPPQGYAPAPAYSQPAPYQQPGYGYQQPAYPQPYGYR